MGKAGILGEERDIMIPNAHINEGRQLFLWKRITAKVFEGNDIAVLQDQWLLFGNYITKQRFIKFFHESTWELWSWNGRFLLSKAIQSASKIKKSVPHDIKVDMPITPQIIRLKQEVH
jgi:hypothetical protein